MSSNIVDLGRVRDARDAKQYRLAQIQTVLDLFTQANGREPDSIEELDRWARSPSGLALIESHCDATGKLKPTYKDIGDER